MKNPDFVHLGPGRTGTTYIFQIFGQHPDIILPATKEINYFGEKYELGINWYQSFFPAHDVAITGDFSNLYFYDKLAVQRLAKDLPTARIFCVLRNPFDRMLSNFLYQQRSGNIEPELSFEEALLKYPDIGEQDHFGDLVAHHMALLEGRFMITFFDDLENDPESFFRELFDFLGIKSDLPLSNLNEKVNAAAALKNPALSKLIRFSADLMRRWNLIHLLDQIKNSKLVQKFLYKEPENAVIRYPEDLVTRINEDIRRLEHITGRDLNHWKQNLQ